VNLKIAVIPALPRPASRYACNVKFVLEYFKLGMKREVAHYQERNRRLSGNLTVMKIGDILPRKYYQYF